MFLLLLLGGGANDASAQQTFIDRLLGRPPADTVVLSNADATAATGTGSFFSNFFAPSPNAARPPPRPPQEPVADGGLISNLFTTAGSTAQSIVDTVLNPQAVAPADFCASFDGGIDMCNYQTHDAMIKRLKDLEAK